MKIFIESSAIFAERSGIGAFVKRLIEAYHQEYPKQQIRLFGFKFVSRKFHPPIPRDKTLDYRLIRWLPGRVYTGLFKNGVPVPIDALLGAGKKDVTIFPNFIRWPLILNRRSIAFIHDLSFVYYGQYSSPANREYMLKYVPKTIAKAEHIITISEASRQDIADHFKIPKSHISIVNPFIDMSTFKRASADEVSRVRKKMKLPRQYILFMSTVEPRKNIQGLLDAYAALKPSIQEQYGLVIAGGKGWLNEEIHAKADRLVAKGLNIVRTGYVADDNLPGLYTGAKLYVYPSFYEGFSISPLEAMACGLPVIVANNSSQPEVVGKAGILIDASKPLEITKEITYLIDHPEVCKKMVAEGYKQAAKFNPKHSAQQLQKAIEKVL